MRKLVVTAASAALLAGTTITTLQAQETQGTAGSQEVIIKKPNANSATEAAPGQKQKSGEASSATEMAPGQQQQSGEADAREAAPGQVKKQDQATGEEQPKTNESAAEDAPGQKQKSGESTAQEAAPGQQQKAGESTAQEAAPGQTKQDQATDETQPSTETTASIDINTEQKTEITRVFREVKSDPVDIDIDVSVGIVVPRTITLHRLPPRVVEIVPAYREYEYFVLADGRIVIVEPRTLRVVYVLIV